MKHLALLVTTVLLLAFFPTQLKAVVNSETPTTTVEADAAHTNLLLARLDEIHGMDKSKLTSGERKVLRREVREIKATLKAVSGGVYLSTGAIILLIILLVILL